MGTFRKVVGVGVIAGVVAYTYLRSLSGKVNRRIAAPEKESAQLV